MTATLADWLAAELRLVRTDGGTRQLTWLDAFRTHVYEKEMDRLSEANRSHYVHL